MARTLALAFLTALALAGCANRSGDLTPAEDAAVVCILKGNQKCGN